MPRLIQFVALAFLFSCSHLPFRQLASSETKYLNPFKIYPDIKVAKGHWNDTELNNIDKALTLLAKTPTGKEQRKKLKGFPLSLYRTYMGDYGDPAPNGSYDDEYNTLGLSSDRVNNWPKERLARLIAHELEHALQHRVYGFTRNQYGLNLTSISEFASMSIEVRVWVELGSKRYPKETSHKDEFVRQRRLIYVRYPRTVHLAWMYSNHYEFPLNFPELRSDHAQNIKNYWKGVMECEMVWRKKNREKLPSVTDEEVISFLSNQVHLYHEYYDWETGRPKYDESWDRKVKISSSLPSFIETHLHDWDKKLPGNFLDNKGLKRDDLAIIKTHPSFLVDIF